LSPPGHFSNMILNIILNIAKDMHDAF